MKLFRRFTRSEDGAVTVDFVVLAAAIVMLAIGVIGIVSSSVRNVAEDIGDGMAAALNAAVGSGSIFGD